MKLLPLTLLLALLCACSTQKLNKSRELNRKGNEVLNLESGVSEADAKKALVYYSKAYRKNPKSEVACIGKGLSYYYLGKYDKSLIEYSKAAGTSNTQGKNAQRYTCKK